jgi:hypothetical protein
MLVTYLARKGKDGRHTKREVERIDRYGEETVLGKALLAAAFVRSPAECSAKGALHAGVPEVIKK